jgi:hypothetical protein
MEPRRLKRGWLFDVIVSYLSGVYHVMHAANLFVIDSRFALRRF